MMDPSSGRSTRKSKQLSAPTHMHTEAAGVQTRWRGRLLGHWLWDANDLSLASLRTWLPGNTAHRPPCIQGWHSAGLPGPALQLRDRACLFCLAGAEGMASVWSVTPQWPQKGKGPCSSFSWLLSYLPPTKVTSKH